MLLLLWSPERQTVFKVLSVPVWMAFLFHMASVFGPFRVPVIFAILILIAISLVSDVTDTKRSSAEGENVCCLYYNSVKLF